MNEYTQPNDPQEADGGNAPTAGLGLRSLAFIADILLLFVIIITVNQFFLTQVFPEGANDFNEYVQRYGELQQNDPEPALTDEAERYIRAFYTFSILFIWLYFSALEYLTKGSSLGKMIFRMYVVREDTGEAASIGSILLRNITKAITLMVFPPFLLFNYILAFLNRRKKAGHDYLARTRVVVRHPAASSTGSQDAPYPGH